MQKQTKDRIKKETGEVLIEVGKKVAVAAIMIFIGKKFPSLNPNGTSKLKEKQ